MSLQRRRSPVAFLGLAWFLLLAPQALFSQSAAGSTPPEVDPGEELLIHGDNFVFKVWEPPGWTGDWSAAKDYEANMIFFPESAESKSFGMSIRIRVNSKQDEDLAQDLAADMEEYRKERPGVQFEDLAVRHPKYATAPKTFFKPSEWYEYVAYLNPGPGDPHIFSVSMSKKRKPATDSELAAFRRVLESITSVGSGQTN